MTMAILINENIYLGWWLTVSEVQTIIIMAVCGTQVLERYSKSCRRQEADRDTLGGILRLENLKAHPYSDTLPLTRPYPLQQSHTS